jgi:diguanylate cyclase (GGDEF)-like protein
MILSRSLRAWGHEVEEAADGDAAAAALTREDGPVAAILDWMMPGKDGPDVCRVVREADLEPYRYLILLTSRSDQEDLVAGLNAGADEYVRKPFDPAELRARLRVGQRLMELQQQLIETRDELHIQATRDGLTMVLNRRSVLDRLNDELARARRRRSGVGVLLVDLDHFKTINDTWGHLAGDAVLREAADRMNRELRSYDVLGRYGGEEFLLAVPDCNKENLLQVAERLRMLLADTPVLAEGQAISVTASIGASWTEGDASDADLIREADEALYDAKRSGRNRVVAGPSCRLASAQSA